MLFRFQFFIYFYFGVILWFGDLVAIFPKTKILDGNSYAFYFFRNAFPQFYT
jgi:hypothetical protein